MKQKRGRPKKEIQVVLPVQTIEKSSIDYYERKLLEVEQDLAAARTAKNHSAVAQLQTKAQMFRAEYDRLIDIQKQKEPTINDVSDGELLENIEATLEELPDLVCEHIFEILRERLGYDS